MYGKCSKILNTLFLKEMIGYQGCNSQKALLFVNSIPESRDNPRMGPIHVDIKDSWAHQFLQRAHKNFKWPIKIWKFAWI